MYFDEFQSHYNCIIKVYFQKIVHCVLNILPKIHKVIFFVIEIFLVLQKTFVKKCYLTIYLLQNNDKGIILFIQSIFIILVHYYNQNFITTQGCDHLLWINFLLAQKSSKEVLSRELKWIKSILLYFEQGLISKVDKTWGLFDLWFKVGEIQWFRGFQGPPTPADQNLCGFDKGRSLVVK